MTLKSKIAGFIAVLTLSAPTAAFAQMADFHVVPLPKEVKATRAGNFELSERTIITYPKGDKKMRRNAELLAEYVEEATGIKLPVTTIPAQQHCIRLTNALKNRNPEAYQLRVNSEIIFIDGATAAGVFYGIQTLRKALPQGQTTKVVLPATEVNDRPRFSYRGAHLDVARHFVGVDSVKRFIDLIALHNINRLHWHLTDDQGWRVEIKKFPLLTKIGSTRPETVIGHNTGKYDGKPHSGFYTQKQLKDIVKYAAERQITIIPEIDLPGHMQAALAAYPELGCTGGPYEVWKQWGVSDQVLCAGNPKIYDFIDGVFDEIVKIFPSEYIHVGGDECPKREWEKCPKCQAFIKANHLEADGKHSAEERLQSYVIRHAEKHLSSLGRKIIGWDETLEGGLAPGATVMSWRGERGGIEAAKLGHDVIMTPNTYLYFDYYQSNQPDLEPIANGGYLPIELVYSYEPMPKALTPEEQKHIVGVQANCWSEYLPTFRNVEYMELPRMAALSELQWCSAEQKDFDAFMERLPKLIDLYRREGYNYAKVIYNVRLDVRPDTSRCILTAELGTFGEADIRYTLDGSKPTISSKAYTGPIELQGNVQLRAAAFRGDEMSAVAAQDFKTGLSTACPIRLLKDANSAYTFSGAQQLIDGIEGGDPSFRTGRWMGFSENDLEAIIDLGAAKEISNVSFNCIEEHANWIFDALGATIEGSLDGTNFTPLASADYGQAKALIEKALIKSHSLDFAPQTTRYLRLKVQAERNMPAWHWAAGKPGFLFVDEIVVK